MSVSIAPPRNALAANMLCLLSMVIWALGLPAAQLVIPLIPPITLTALRALLAAAVLIPLWIVIEGTRPILTANWGRGILIGGVCIGFGAVLLVVAQAKTDPVTVAVITAIMPVIGITLEVAFEGRKLTIALILGLALSLFGGFMAYGAGVGSMTLGIGALAALGSVLAFTWGSRATVTAFPDLTPLGRTAITVSGAAILTTIMSLIYSGMGGPATQWSALGLPEWGALALFGIGSLAISQVLWIMAVGQLGIGLSSLHMNAVPFYVMIIMFALGAAWNWPQAYGAVIVALGVLIAQGLIRLPR
ncbi:MAG: DMT family transporter [Alphaproteobacteria bacterium]